MLIYFGSLCASGSIHSVSLKKNSISQKLFMSLLICSEISLFFSDSYLTDHNNINISHSDVKLLT